MKDNISLIASVSVIAIVVYAAWLLSDVDRTSILRINATLKTVSDTLGTTPTAEKLDVTRIILYSGIVLLIIATLYIMLKGKR